MPEVSGAPRDAEFYKREEIKKQKQRIALGCNPEKPCILKCKICFEEDCKTKK